MTEPHTHEPLRRTPLHALHLALGARMGPFAGYDLPIQYADGVMAEHKHTRAAAGLFDVSHMGQITVRARTGRFPETAAALESVIGADLLGLTVGRQRYALLTDAAGGVLDDLMVARSGLSELTLVVNAANKAADLALLRARIGATCDVTLHEDRALLALQGPQAEAAFARVAPEAAAVIAAMRFMDYREIALAHGPRLALTRSGYTGEDGFEIALPAADATGFAERLLADAAVKPIGLGARDSLRLEAGLCLCGSDLDPTISPIEAGLAWAIAPVRRAGGARAGGFAGAERILRELAEGPTRRRVGLLPEGRQPVRGGADLFAQAEGGAPIGRVTSGAFGPTLEAPVAIGYLPAAHAALGARVYAEVRGKRLPAVVAALPFTPARFKR